jgi:hypothetical protein
LEDQYLNRWVYNVKADLVEVGWGDVDWISLVQDWEMWTALVSAVMNLRGYIKCWETVEWLHNWWPLE